MNRCCLLSAVAAALLCGMLVSPARAIEQTPMNAIAQYRAQMYAWHGNYYHTSWGVPVSLVVPPTAELHTEYGWGVTNTRIVPIYHQFGRNFPGTGYSAGFAPTPLWPNDTTQFGVYYVRGPW